MISGVKENFNKYAEKYDENAVVQKTMADELFNNLKKYKDIFNNILEIGCGTGNLSSLLINNLKYDKIFLNDISEKMIQRTSENINDKDKVNFLNENFEDLKSNKKFELICSSATFQWFNNLDKSFSKIYEMLNQNGILLFSTFIEDTFSELDNSFKLTYQEMNLPYKKVTLDFKNKDDILLFLKKNNFLIENSYVKEYKYYFNHPKEFLRSVREIGAKVNSDEITKVSVMRKMFDNYIKLYQNEERKIVATYKVFYCICKKGVSK
ncbi:MAG TPA: malonyl-ACP O-methyltransferase BioC [Spirochaetota bacterium]|nr:malonyl-ACP O-methyltransferase BioC [Spirochaetota bacterium]